MSFDKTITVKAAFEQARAVHDTAYPHLKSAFEGREREKFYTTSQVESMLAQGCTSGKPVPRE